jgi:hypothetical protein
VNGGSLRVVSQPAGFDATYALPAANWSPIGAPGAVKGYRYGDALLAAGPVKSIVIRNGTLLRVSGSGTGLALPLATDPDPVDVVLTVGAQRLCLRFGGTTSFTPGGPFSAKDAPAPAACAP